MWAWSDVCAFWVETAERDTALDETNWEQFPKLEQLLRNLYVCTTVTILGMDKECLLKVKSLLHSLHIGNLTSLERGPVEALHVPSTK